MMVTAQGWERGSHLSWVVVAAMLAGGVTGAAGFLVFAVDALRALQWGMLVATSVIAVAAVVRLPVRWLRWPDPPATPPSVGWHGVTSVQERMRREAAEQRRRRRGQEIR